MSSAQQAPGLTRLGHLLIDLRTVSAVLPLQSGTPDEDYGFTIITSGGSLEIRDSETIAAVREHFFQGKSNP